VRRDFDNLPSEGVANTLKAASAKVTNPIKIIIVWLHKGPALGLLEKMGLVERKAHPTDGRQINIKLTAQGITLRRNTKEATYAWLSRAIAELDRQEQITLFKAGELFKRMAETMVLTKITGRY
jgi:hypothetical protein